MQNNEPESSIPSTSVNSLITAERIPSEQILGLNPQEASILNFLRVDAAEKQRDRRYISNIVFFIFRVVVGVIENLKSLKTVFK